MTTRKQMLDFLKKDVLKTPAIVRAFEAVDRVGFVPEKYKEYAYSDRPLPIGSGQTISQPWTVAFMTEALEPKKGQKVLEVGTGSGWQAAILSRAVGSKGEVVTIEKLEALFHYAAPLLKKYKNIKRVLGDGSKGYKPEAPYDRIIVTASAPSVPMPLFEQLKEGGVLVIPVRGQMLKVKKAAGKRQTERLGGFRFVPLKGEHGFR